MSKFIKKETCHYSYQIIVTSFDSERSESFFYGSYTSARICFRYLLGKLKSDKSVKSIAFYYFCMRFDNSGNVKVGFAKSKKDAYNNSLPEGKVFHF